MRPDYSKDWIPAFAGMTDLQHGLRAHATFLSGESDEDYEGDKVQAGSTQLEFILVFYLTRDNSNHSLQGKIWSGPTEGTSTGATLISDVTGFGSTGAGTLYNYYTVKGVVQANHYLMFEWVTCTGSGETFGLHSIATVDRG